MNKIRTFITLVIIVSLIISCNCEDCGGEDGNYPIKATISFINETSDIVKSSGCKKDLEPNEMHKLVIREVLGTKINNINEFPVSIFTNCTMKYQNGNNFKCEQKIYDIKNYENKKQLESIKDTLVFELTFKFTEEKKMEAEDCS